MNNHPVNTQDPKLKRKPLRIRKRSAATIADAIMLRQQRADVITSAVRGVPSESPLHR
jgi:hypothetical protein